MAESIGRDGPPDEAAARPKTGLAPPGLEEYPHRPGWFAVVHLSHVVAEPFKHVRLGIAVSTVVTAAVLITAYLVITGLLDTINRLVH